MSRSLKDRSVLRIASGQGFWGDLQRAPIDQARLGPIDVLVMDYLAEVTMSIMQKQKLRDPSTGYAFSTFGYYRIRGAVYDGLRSMGHLPRSEYDKLKAARRAFWVGDRKAYLRPM